MTSRSSDLQSDSDLDSIRNSCDVFVHILASDSGKSYFASIFEVKNVIFFAEKLEGLVP